MLIIIGYEFITLNIFRYLLENQHVAKIWFYILRMYNNYILSSEYNIILMTLLLDHAQ